MKFIEDNDLKQLMLENSKVGRPVYKNSFDKDEIINMTRAWDREKPESPTGIEPMTSRTPGGRSIH